MLQNEGVWDFTHSGYNLHLTGVIFLSLLPHFILAWMHNETLLHLYFFLEVPSGTSKSSIFILAACFILT
jgi:hypothetical protein